MNDYRLNTAKPFYKSILWRQTRDAYFRKAGGLCEVCLAKGLIVPGEIVHHKVELTAENIDDPTVALNFDNLQLVCRECHADLHGAKEGRRSRIDEFGSEIL